MLQMWRGGGGGGSQPADDQLGGSSDSGHPPGPPPSALHPSAAPTLSADTVGRSMSGELAMIL